MSFHATARGFYWWQLVGNMALLCPFLLQPLLPDLSHAAPGGSDAAFWPSEELFPFFFGVSFPLDQPVELTHLAAMFLLGMISRNQSEYMPLTYWGTQLVPSLQLQCCIILAAIWNGNNFTMVHSSRKLLLCEQNAFSVYIMGFLGLVCVHTHLHRHCVDECQGFAQVERMMYLW